MNKILIIALLLLSINTYSQQKNVPLLIGETETEIRTYFNSLIAKSNIAGLEIKRNVTNSGNLVLELQLPITEESRFNCINILTTFYRFSKEIELCNTQIVYGSNGYAKANIDFVRDNFKVARENLWEIPFKIPAFKITAQFERHDETYSVTYKLKEIPK